MPRSIVTTTTRKPREARHRWSSRRQARRNAAPAREASPAGPLRAARSVMSGRAGLVTDATDGHDDLGPLGVVLDLGAQPLDVDVDEAGVARVAGAPHLLEEHLAGEDLPGLARQRDEQVELERRQGQRLAVALDGVAGHVDLEVADRQLLGRGLVAAAQPGADAGDELLRLEGLDDVVVGTGLEPHD